MPQLEHSVNPRADSNAQIELAIRVPGCQEHTKTKKEFNSDSR